jgi:hypothetical protein
MGYQVQSDGSHSATRCASLSGVFDAAISIANERRSLLLELRNALVNGDDQAALKHARKLCGLNDEACN